MTPDDIPDTPDDPWWTADERLPPWPEWVRGFRSWQVDAARELVDGYQRGADVMMLDAPTGTGKTVIGEMVRRAMYRERGGRATYVCHSLRLQDQFLEDFRYASVVKGRSNYPTEHGPGWVTASDCTGPPGKCTFCDETCPYLEAKGAALGSGIAVANTAYWLYETNYVREGLRGRKGLVLDECDTLENALMGFVEVFIGTGTQRKAGVQGLKKGAHVGTVVAWLGDVAAGLMVYAKANRANGDVKVRRDVKNALSTAAKVRRLAEELETGDEDEGATRWVRDYPYGKNEGAVVYRPVKVDQAAASAVWARTGISDGGWVLGMSATFVSADEWADSCGVDVAGLDRGVVRVSSPFPVENRQVLYVPCGDMAHKTWERDMPKMVEGLVKILARHPRDAILVHATNYKIARALVDGIRRTLDGTDGARRVFTHDSARERDEALHDFELAADQGEGPVIVSPSLDRGVDLPGDKCRVQVVAKVPFPNLGDRQVSERLYAPGGQAWFTTQTARTLIQMTGRGVRSVDDYAVTYVMDSQFGRWWKDGKRVVPKWWGDAVKAGRL